MRTRPGRVFASAALLVLAACAGPDSDPDADGPANASAREDVASALDDPRHAGFPDPLIDLDHLVSGGPPPGGIPPIDNPKFVDAAAVDWLDEREPVLALTVAGETRAYPQQVLTWHEIVNGIVGGPGRGHLLSAVPLRASRSTDRSGSGCWTSAPPGCCTPTTW